MPKLACGRLVLIRYLCLISLMVAIAGCGADFFPAYKRLPTTPDPFSFTPKTNVALSTAVTSDPITVAGLTGDSSPVSVTGPAGSNSQYSINGAAATSTAGTVKNGDTVTVTQTSSNSPGIVTPSTLTIGNINGAFTTTTQIVATPVFGVIKVAPGALGQASATLLSLDGIAGTHSISIIDGLNSQSSVYFLNDNPAGITHLPQTIPNLNGRVITVQNLAPSTSGASVKTTLTIDGIPSVFTLTAQ